MEIIFLGTGAPLHVSRAMTGMLIRAEGCAPLLIDTCGGFELARSLSNAEFPLSQIRNVVVTHRHFDHTGGMMALFMANMPLDIHALDDTYTGIREMKAGCIPDTELHPEVLHHRIQFGEKRDIGGFAAEFVQVEHRVPTAAIRITYRGRTLAFSADSLPCEGLTAVARDADLFICDTMCAERDGDSARSRTRSLMHPTAREAAEIASRAGVHRLACVHIARFGSPPNILEEAQEGFGGLVEVPNDGDRYLI
jgi:ribonuclease BN (tRNA processing enzyme)